MWFGLGLIGLVIWIAIAFWPARVASRKGRSFFLWFLLSIPFWWITLFVAYAMKDNTTRSSTTSTEE